MYYNHYNQICQLTFIIDFMLHVGRYMGRKCAVVNQTSAERIAQLINISGLTQAQFGDLVGYDRVSINAMANGKRNLTRGGAESICKHYPQYRVEWLLGYDDYATHDYKSIADDKFFAALSTIGQAFRGLAWFDGYEFNSEEIDAKGEATNCDLIDIPSEMTESPIINIFCWGKKIGVCSPKEYNQLIIEVADFVDFKLKRLSENNSHQIKTKK